MKNPEIKVQPGFEKTLNRLQTFEKTRKKKLEEQRYELKMYLNMTQGPQAYDELLEMEGQIRKERQATIYKQQKLRKQIQFKHYCLFG